MPTSDDAFCDFCSAPGPKWEYPITGEITTSMPISGRAIEYGDEDWAACDECAAYIDEDRFGDLLEANIRKGPRPNGDPSSRRYQIGMNAVRVQKAELYAQIATRHGPRRPFSSTS